MGTFFKTTPMLGLWIISSLPSVKGN